MPQLQPAFDFLSLGALLQSFRINGKSIVLGFDRTEQYEKYNDFYFGETIGRIANRVSGAKIKNFNGRSYDLIANNGPNALHGGPTGLGKRKFSESKVIRNGAEAHLFTYVSKDGEEGYPGNVMVSVWYTPSNKLENGLQKTCLEIEYEVKLLEDENDTQETVISLTNHSYFNLADTLKIDGTEVTLATTRYLVVDGTGIPTGKVADYPGITAKTPFTLGVEEPDIDDCFIMNENPSEVSIDTRMQSARLYASFYHPQSKIALEIRGTDPAFQFYTGKYIDAPPVDGLPARGARSGFCVEPSRFVNAVNVDEWKSMVLLRKGEKYGSKIYYSAWEESR